MTDKPYVVGALVGALVGGAIGHFYFTEAGRRHLNALGGTFDRLLLDFDEVGNFWSRVNLAVDEYQTTVRHALEGPRAGGIRAGRPQGAV